MQLRRARECNFMKTCREYFHAKTNHPRHYDDWNASGCIISRTAFSTVLRDALFTRQLFSRINSNNDKRMGDIIFRIRGRLYANVSTAVEPIIMRFYSLHKPTCRCRLVLLTNSLLIDLQCIIDYQYIINSDYLLLIS